MGHPATGPHVITGREDYRRWVMDQPRGRYERVAGMVVAMVPERVAHVRVKARVWQALDRAIREAGVPCEALADGVTVEVVDDTDYEPDAVVNCGERLGGDALAAPDPVVVVEVLSPSTQSVDTGAKLADYLSLSSVRHYLVVRADRRAVVHHRRAGDGAIETRLIADGPIMLDPPGIHVETKDFYAP